MRRGIRSGGGAGRRQASRRSSGAGRRRSAAVWALAVVAVAGCYNVGVVPPPGITRVAVPFFRNETFPLERDLEYAITREIRTRLEEQTSCILVSGEDAADAVLEGAVIRFQESVAAEDGIDRPVRSFAYAEITVKFRRTGPQGEIIFADTFPVRVAFQAGTGRDTAKEEMVRRIADRVLAWAFTTWVEE